MLEAVTMFGISYYGFMSMTSLILTYTIRKYILENHLNAHAVDLYLKSVGFWRSYWVNIMAAHQFNLLSLIHPGGEDIGCSNLALFPMTFFAIPILPVWSIASKGLQYSAIILTIFTIACFVWIGFLRRIYRKFQQFG